MKILKKIILLSPICLSLMQVNAASCDITAVDGGCTGNGCWAKIPLCAFDATVTPEVNNSSAVYSIVGDSKDASKFAVFSQKSFFNFNGSDAVITYNPTKSIPQSLVNFSSGWLNASKTPVAYWDGLIAKFTGSAWSIAPLNTNDLTAINNFCSANFRNNINSPYGNKGDVQGGSFRWDYTGSGGAYPSADMSCGYVSNTPSGVSMVNGKDWNKKIIAGARNILSDGSFYGRGPIFSCSAEQVLYTSRHTSTTAGKTPSHTCYVQKSEYNNNGVYGSLYPYFSFNVGDNSALSILSTKDSKNLIFGLGEFSNNKADKCASGYFFRDFYNGNYTCVSYNMLAKDGNAINESSFAPYFAVETPSGSKYLLGAMMKFYDGRQNVIGSNFVGSYNWDNQGSKSHFEKEPLNTVYNPGNPTTYLYRESDQDNSKFFVYSLDNKNTNFYDMLYGSYCIFKADGSNADCNAQPNFALPENYNSAGVYITVPGRNDYFMFPVRNYNDSSVNGSGRQYLAMVPLQNTPTQEFGLYQPLSEMNASIADITSLKIIKDSKGEQYLYVVDANSSVFKMKITARSSGGPISISEIENISGALNGGQAKVTNEGAVLYADPNNNLMVGDNLGNAFVSLPQATVSSCINSQKTTSLSFSLKNHSDNVKPLFTNCSNGSSCPTGDADDWKSYLQVVAKSDPKTPASLTFANGSYTAVFNKVLPEGEDTSIQYKINVGGKESWVDIGSGAAKCTSAKVDMTFKSCDFSVSLDSTGKTLTDNANIDYSVACAAGVKGENKSIKFGLQSSTSSQVTQFPIPTSDPNCPALGSKCQGDLQKDSSAILPFNGDGKSYYPYATITTSCGIDEPNKTIDITLVGDSSCKISSTNMASLNDIMSHINNCTLYAGVGLLTYDVITPVVPTGKVNPAAIKACVTQAASGSGKITDPCVNAVYSSDPLPSSNLCPTSLGGLNKNQCSINISGLSAGLNYVAGFEGAYNFDPAIMQTNTSCTVVPGILEFNATTPGSIGSCAYDNKGNLTINVPWENYGGTDLKNLVAKTIDKIDYTLYFNDSVIGTYSSTSPADNYCDGTSGCGPANTQKLIVKLTAPLCYPTDSLKLATTIHYKNDSIANNNQNLKFVPNTQCNGCSSNANLNFACDTVNGPRGTGFVGFSSSVANNIVLCDSSTDPNCSNSMTVYDSDALDAAPITSIVVNKIYNQASCPGGSGPTNLTFPTAEDKITDYRYTIGVFGGNSKEECGIASSKGESGPWFIENLASSSSCVAVNVDTNYGWCAYSGSGAKASPPWKVDYSINLFGNDGKETKLWNCTASCYTCTSPGRACYKAVPPPVCNKVG